MLTESVGGGCEGLYFGGCLYGGWLGPCLESSLLDSPASFFSPTPTLPSPDPARVLNMPPVIYVPVGIHGYIRCPVDAEPPATVVKWNKDGRPLQVEKVLKRRVWGTHEMHPPNTKVLPLLAGSCQEPSPEALASLELCPMVDLQLAGHQDTPPQGSRFLPGLPPRGASEAALPGSGHVGAGTGVHP